MEMEIDDDIFNDDPIEIFLKCKLASLKEANKQLEVPIEEFIGQLEDENSNGTSTLVIGPYWKKVCDGKIVIGMEISGSSNLNYENFNISFQWCPVITPQFTTKIFKNTATSTVLIVFNQNFFIKCLKYEAQVTLWHEDPVTKSTTIDKLEPLLIESQDLTSNEFEVKSMDLINGSEDAIHAKVACSCEIKLAAALSRGVLRDYLIIDCMFRELSNRGTRQSGSYYFLEGVSQQLNGCLLLYEDKEEYYTEVTLYFRDKSHLYQILHFLHRSIRGLNVVPLKCKSLLQLLHQQKTSHLEDEERMFESQRTGSDDQVHAFGESLLRQFDCIIDFHKSVLDNSDVPKDRDVSELYRAFRASLTQHEYQTDNLFRKISPYIRK